MTTTGREWSDLSPAEFKGRRLAMGYSSDAISRALKVRLGTVIRWENGQRPIPLGVEQDLKRLEEKWWDFGAKLAANAVVTYDPDDEDELVSITIHVPDLYVGPDLAAAAEAKRAIEAVNPTIPVRIALAL